MSVATEPSVEFEAEYALESSVHCPSCRKICESLQVVRLLRRRVNFTSTLPRRGYIVVCPHCHAALPAVIGSRA